MSIINTALIGKLKKIKADKDNVLGLDNTTVYTPISDYHPATKKYVDDSLSSAGGSWTISDGTNSETIAASDTLTVTGSGTTNVVYNPATNILNISSTDASATFTRFEYVATAGQTIFTGNDIHGNSLAYVNGMVIPTIDGFVLHTDDFTETNSSTITLSSPATVGQDIVLFAYNSVEMLDGMLMREYERTMNNGDNIINDITYTPNYIEVYAKGIKLVNGTDFTATNGSTITFTPAFTETTELVVKVNMVVPSNNVYTKTETDTLLDAKIDDAQVLTDVPAGAVFTDTVYSHPATHPASMLTGALPAIDGSQLTGIQTDPYDTDSTSTGYFDLPSGTTAQRPTNPNHGYTRFNTNIDGPEWWSETYGSWTKFSDPPSIPIEYVVVAGGAGGGSQQGGGGGAGGYLTGSIYATSGYSSSVVVGAGGGHASNGGASSGFGTNTVGGGNGGNYSANGGSGGSGGGGNAQAGNRSGGSGTAGQGFAGGGSSSGQAGGGGGASESGNADGLRHGGDGLTWLNGVTYSGGGAGGAANGVHINGGNGGGGQGSGSAYQNGTAGSVNTGGGGGGGGSTSGVGNTSGGNGGSGIVVARYVGTSAKATGGTITYAGGYVYHTFTSSSTFTLTL